MGNEQNYDVGWYQSKGFVPKYTKREELKTQKAERHREKGRERLKL